MVLTPLLLESSAWLEDSALQKLNAMTGSVSFTELDMVVWLDQG